MSGKRIDAGERQRIVDLLQEHGGNRYKVAQIVKRAPNTVKKIADQEGIPTARAHLKKADEARAVFTEEKRRAVVIKGLQKCDQMLDRPIDAQDLQRLSIAIGVLVDKDLLLSGRPTSINETRRSQELRDLVSGGRAEAQDEWKP